MVSPVDLRELRSMIEEARVILNTTALPAGRPAQAKELLETAVARLDEIIEAQPWHRSSAGKG
jgi:hypothetical protein